MEQEIQRLMADNPDVLSREEAGLCHGNLGNVMIGSLADIDLWKGSLQKNALESIQVLREVFLRKMCIRDRLHVQVHMQIYLENKKFVLYGQIEAVD